ncbi:MAG TPA: PrgI family protein [Ktedonobacteraceae bacterium]|nr:PrgI family protein [Ktedonobacteraceae bacterium]
MLSSSSSTRATSRTHTVPTHLNLPDQVLTLWSFNLTARQLLVLLVGGGIGGDLWHALAMLGHTPIVGQGVRLLCTLLPLVLALVVAWYRPAGRYVEVWCLVLLRYQVQPRRYVWRTLRHSGLQQLAADPLASGADERVRAHRSATPVANAVTGQEVA